jgi:hypothetical protein
LTHMISPIAHGTDKVSLLVTRPNNETASSAPTR